MAEYLGMSLEQGTNATKVRDQLSQDYRIMLHQNDM